MTASRRRPRFPLHRRSLVSGTSSTRPSLMPGAIASDSAYDVDLSGVRDVDVRDAIDELRRWLHTCADSERDLLCFVG
jgi:hypothetical protein